MSISLNANFELLSAGLYLDARQQFNTIIEMKDFAETSIPDGFITYNKETQKHYVFNSSNTVDATLGKWREYNSGDSSSTTYATWNSNVDYKVGNVVLKDEVRYSCIADHTSTDFETDSINWVVVLEQYYHVTQEQYNKMVSDGLITDGTKDLYIIDGNNEGGDIPLGQQVYSNTPIGTVLSFAGQVSPNGYLLCDGGSYAVADYPDLYNVIGNTYGGDTEYFNVPNLIDRFIQGSDTSGTEIEAGLPNITGSINNSAGGSGDQFLTDSEGTLKINGSLFITEYAKRSNIKNGDASYNTPTGLGLDASLSNTIYGNSDTVQPPALTMAYFIKAFHTNEGVDSFVELEDNVVNHINNQIDNYVNNQIDNRIDNRIDGRLDELFQSVSDGKTLVANAITDKGVSTSSTDTFATMASNIRNINGAAYTSERLSNTKLINRGGTASISITFSNTVLGVTSVDYNFDNDYLTYKGFSVSGNKVTVKITLSSAYGQTTGTVGCNVTANILA